MYQLVPYGNNLVIEPIKAKDVKQFTGKVLADIETSGMDVLQYGRVVAIKVADEIAFNIEEGDIVLYEKLASHKTNVGDPRQVLVDIDHIHAKLEEV